MLTAAQIVAAKKKKKKKPNKIKQRAVRKGVKKVPVCSFSGTLCHDLIKKAN